MKRYLVFRGEHYYPSGGWHDLDNTFDTLPEVLQYLHTDNCLKRSEWVHVVDITTGLQVSDYGQ